MLLFSSVAFAIDVHLTYEDRLPASSPNGASVVVRFEDGRSPDYGGGNLRMLGYNHSSAGIPRRMESDRSPVDEWLLSWLADCATAEGFAVVATGAPVVTLRLQKLWTAGWARYTGTVDFVLSTGSWTHAVRGTSDKTYWSPKSIQQQYDELLVSLTPEVRSALAEPGFSAALRKAPSTRPGCTKDTDCKGDRICSDGRCATP